MASESKKKKIQIMEAQDAEGVSRKTYKHTMSPNLFIAIKLILVCLIPIVYFIYSPLLLGVFILYIGLFFLARMAERSMNKSVIRSNHIHISKIDSGLALIIVIIALCGGFMELIKKNETSSFRGMDNSEFAEMRQEMDISKIKNFSKTQSIKENLISIGSLLTGERNLFSLEQELNFSGTKPPDDFIKDSSEIPELPDDKDFEGKGDFKGGGGRGKNFNFSMDNIPLEYVSSSTLSTINTILIFSVSVMGAISIIAIFIKKHKFERDMNEVIVEGKITMLSDEELDRILSFGEDVEENKLSKKEINKLIKDKKLEDEKQNAVDPQEEFTTKKKILKY